LFKPGALRSYVLSTSFEQNIEHVVFMLFSERYPVFNPTKELPLQYTSMSNKKKSQKEPEQKLKAASKSGQTSGPSARYGLSETDLEQADECVDFLGSRSIVSFPVECENGSEGASDTGRDGSPISEDHPRLEKALHNVLSSTHHKPAAPAVTGAAFPLAEHEIRSELSELKEMIATLAAAMATAINELKKYNKNELKKANIELKNELKKDIIEIKKDNKDREIDRLAALEDGYRRNNIRTECIPEKRESSSPVKFAVELLSKIIGDDFKLDIEIAAAYHTYRSSTFKPRSFIVRFEQLQCKLDVMALLRHKQEIIFENNLIRIFPDFSPLTTAKRAAYFNIKKLLQKAYIKYSLLYPAKLKVEVQDQYYIFSISFHLTGLNTKIVFLQETHLLSKDQFRLQKDWTGQMFHSNFIKKTRGVGILIHRTVSFVASDVVSDPEGRYVMVTGNLYNSKMILINVYAPNVKDKEFMQNLFASIPNVNTHKIIMAGDFNCVLNPLLDRTPVTGGTTSNTAKTITQFLNDHNLSDPWRFLNPNSRIYSFYSPMHYSYSRIDYFFIDNNFLPTIKSCKYDTIVISDHAPLVLELKSISPSHSPRRWCLNPLLLADENCTEFISKQISFFLQTNTPTEVSAGTLWETLKAFLRGQIISYLSHRNKLETKKVSELRSEITRIDEEQPLAQQIHKQEVCNAIPVITNTNGEEIIDHKNIMHAFRDYYKSLYSTELKEDNTQSNAFLDTLETPQIDALSAEELDKRLTLTELLDAIKSLQSGKSAGPDGYPVEFYKKFSTQLAPLLLATFTEARDNQILPQTFRQAFITVFPKQNKDLLQCESYRPISLLNNDVKILSKILARRMEKVLPSVISQDQTGFIKGRHLFSNLRRLFNVIYSPAKSNTPEILLLLDAEKAFDMIEWNYLFTALEKFGFGPNICGLLYTNPEASVCINNICSDYFKLERGTRQGCPLSPLLFAIAIEPLVVHCRNSYQIKGIIREGLEQKISLYADDMVLYISDPENTVPAVLTALTEFQKISGLRINLNKSILFPVNSQVYNIRLDTLSFTIADQFKYLGVNVTSKHKALYQQNFAVCMEKIKQDLHRWSTLHLTLAGRINIVKMNILPKLLLLFQNIPIYINKSFFKQLDSTITSFIWNSNHLRI
uniref:Reverse transcriptase domain-containing protein n=1 Tax=Erpetoichthys calabaricus TaxID=27687 RepID=A0A8C4S0K8_ERPCA